MDLFELDYHDTPIVSDADKYEYDEHFIYVDSRTRNTKEENVLDSKIYNLTLNPLYFTQNSNKICVMCNGHTLQKGDLIVLDNVVSESWTAYYKFTVQDDKLYIDSVETDSVSVLSVNTLKNTFNNTTYLTLKNIIQSQYFIGQILTNWLCEKQQLYMDESNNIYIVLDKPYQPVSYVKYCTVELQSLSGIPLEYLNANFPLDAYHKQGYYEVLATKEDYIYFNVQFVASSTTSGGGNNVILCKVLNNTVAYLTPSSYEINLEKTFTNVVQMEVVASEIPYIVKNINEKNNIFYWINRHSTKINSVKLEFGVYSNQDVFTTLLSTLKNYNSEFDFSGSYSRFFFNLQCFLVHKLYRPFLITETTLKEGQGYKRSLILKFPRHNLKSGDTIEIEGAIGFLGIPKEALNGKFSVEVLTSDTVQIYLNDYNKDLTLIDVDNGGGNTVIVKTPEDIKVLDLPNNIFQVLGISNFTEFVSILKNDKPVKAVPSPYVKLFCYPNTMISNQSTDYLLTKFRFDGRFNDYVYDTYGKDKLFFPQPIKLLNKLAFEFFYADNETMVDFLNYDNSFTIKIICKRQVSEKNEFTTNSYITQDTHNNDKTKKNKRSSQYV